MNTWLLHHDHYVLRWTFSPLFTHRFGKRVHGGLSSSIHKIQQWCNTLLIIEGMFQMFFRFLDYHLNLYVCYRSRPGQGQERLRWPCIRLNLRIENASRVTWTYSSYCTKPIMSSALNAYRSPTATTLSKFRTSFLWSFPWRVFALSGTQLVEQTRTLKWFTLHPVGHCSTPNQSHFPCWCLLSLRPRHRWRL